MICAACRITRRLSDLLAFWPIGRPGERRFVCRPTSPSPEARIPCFGAAVGPANVHAIALAEPAVPFEAVSERPVRPGTRAWTRLLSEAGVYQRAAA